MPIYKRVSQRKARRYKPYTKKQRTFRDVITAIPSYSPSLGSTGFPRTLRVKLKYHETVAFSSATGAVSSNIFRLNSLFDPNETGVGGQPMYYDQLAAVYGKYVVLNSVIKCTFAPVTETAATSCWNVGIVGNQNATISTDGDTNAEQRHSAWAIINGRTGGPNQKTLMLRFNLKDNLNLSYIDSDAQAATNANPDQSYKGVVWCNDIQSTGTTNLIGAVEIIYDVMFSQATYLAGS